MLFRKLEDLRFRRSPDNLAYQALEGLRGWCEKRGLHPNTVKVIDDFGDVFHKTALGWLVGIEPDPSCLTPQETELKSLFEASHRPGELTSSEGRERPEVAVILDIDGVLVSLWPSLASFWEMLKKNRIFLLPNCGTC